MIETAPGSITVFADIACPWAHVAVHRLHEWRRRLGLEERVRFEMRAFVLELVNRRATPKPTLDAEIPVAGGLEPDAGWTMWPRPAYDYPVTTLPALEAVYAAKDQGPAAGEALDRALRRALFAEGRNVSLLHEILDVAERCPEVSLQELAKALEHGDARSRIFEDMELAERSEVRGSPHLFLPDGSSAHNPGIEMHWVDGAASGSKRGGFPAVERDDPSIYEQLLTRAAG